MTSMRERMARAAHKSLGYKRKLEHCTASYRHDLATIIDAILAEMETPSHEMIDAASFVYGSYDDHEDVFVSMIRAIRDGK